MEEIDEFIIPVTRIVCLLTDSVSEFLQTLDLIDKLEITKI